jgi:hypothetical protein
MPLYPNDARHRLLRGRSLRRSWAVVRQLPRPLTGGAGGRVTQR